MKRNFLISLCLLVVLGFMALTGLLALGNARVVSAQLAPTPIPGKEAWSQPLFLLPRASAPTAALSPDGFTAYCASSTAWGVIVGMESRAWAAGNFTKISGQGFWVNCVYDSDGTLHIVWQEELEIRYAKLFRDGTVSTPRILSRELLHAQINTTGPWIAFSSKLNRLFVVFQSLPNNSGETWHRYFSESADQGATWGDVYEFDQDDGYRPAAPHVVVEPLSGNPVLVWGKMAPDAVTWNWSAVLSSARDGSGNWSAPVQVGINYAAAPATHRTVFGIGVAVSPQGGIYAAWHQDADADQFQVLFSHRLSSGAWQTPRILDHDRDPLGVPAITVGTNGFVWVMWPRVKTDTRFAVSTDGGVSFGGSKVAYIGKDLFFSRLGPLSLVSVPTTKRIRVIQEVSQDNPIYVQDATLVLAEIDEGATNPPAPTPAPPAVIPSPTPTLPTSTPVGTLAAGQDGFEPDNTLAQALANGKLLVANGLPQVHSLYDPSNSDRQRDIDVIPFEARAGLYYTLTANANPRPNFQLKVSVYTTVAQAKGNAVGQGQNPGYVEGGGVSVEGVEMAGNAAAPGLGGWLGTTNECNGDKTRLCFTFKAEQNGIYFGQFSNYLSGNGSPTDLYTVRLLEQSEPPISPTPALSPTVTGLTFTPGSATSAPAASLTPEVTATPTVSSVTTPGVSPVTSVTQSAAGNTPTGVTSVVTTAVTNVSTTNSATTYPQKGQSGSGSQSPVGQVATPAPSPTLLPQQQAEATNAAQVKATLEAYQEQQRLAALTPQLLPIEALNPNQRGGQGPLLAPPDYTPPPTPLPLPTSTPTPMAAGKGAVVTPMAATRTVSPDKSGLPLKSNRLIAPPAQLGEWWLLGLALLCLGKAGLNLWSVRATHSRRGSRLATRVKSV